MRFNPTKSRTEAPTEEQSFAPVPVAEEPSSKRFTVIVMRTALFQTEIDVEAADEDEAELAAYETVERLDEGAWEDTYDYEYSVGAIVEQD